MAIEIEIDGAKLRLWMWFWCFTIGGIIFHSSLDFVVAFGIATYTLLIRPFRLGKW